MWKPEHRRAADRRGMRYPSDMTDAEWALVEPPIPPAKRGGRQREVNVREVLNAMFYVLSTGCQWKRCRRTFRPRARRIAYFMLWDWDGTLERIHHALYIATREREGREASPTAAIIDSQSAKAAKRGLLLDPQGYDAGKKVTGRKRHILVDTLGLLLNVVVHPADMQDRDGAALVLTDARVPVALHRSHLRRCRIPGAAAARPPQDRPLDIEIVKRNELHKFVVLPKRWIVERTLAWISRNRRLMRDFERYARTVAAFIRLAMIQLMLRRLTRSNPCT